jgi:hypothetical protein
MKPNKQPVYTGAGARRSRLLAQDRRADPLSAMSACGTKRTSRRCRSMSAFRGKADIAWTDIRRLILLCRTTAALSTSGMLGCHRQPEGRL